MALTDPSVMPWPDLISQSSKTMFSEGTPACQPDQALGVSEDRGGSKRSGGCVTLTQPVGARFHAEVVVVAVDHRVAHDDVARGVDIDAISIGGVRVLVDLYAVDDDVAAELEVEVLCSRALRLRQKTQRGRLHLPRRGRCAS